MTIGAHTVEWQGERLDLLPDKAVWWPARTTLFVADVHLGKAATFRARGIPAPECPHRDDLARLSALIQSTAARRLIILGDLLHARAGCGPDVMAALADWRNHLGSVGIFLTEGNHDAGCARLPDELRISTATDLHASPFTCIHDAPEQGGPFLCGHVHPKFRLRTPSESLTLPCFHLSAGRLVLPSFGSFTGGHLICPAPADRVFVIAGNEVVPVSITTRTNPTARALGPRQANGTG